MWETARVPAFRPDRPPRSHRREEGSAMTQDPPESDRPNRTNPPTTDLTAASSSRIRQRRSHARRHPPSCARGKSSPKSSRRWGGAARCGSQAAQTETHPDRCRGHRRGRVVWWRASAIGRCRRPPLPPNASRKTPTASRWSCRTTTAPDTPRPRWLFFFYGGHQYRYYYGSSGPVGSRPIGGTTTVPKGATIKTKFGQHNSSAALLGGKFSAGAAAREARQDTAPTEVAVDRRIARVGVRDTGP